MNWPFDGHLESADGQHVRGLIRPLKTDDPIELNGEIQSDTVFLWTGSAATADEAALIPTRRFYRLRRTDDDILQGTWLGAQDPEPRGGLVVMRFTTQ